MVEFEKIQLSPILLQSLYSNSLVQLEADKMDFGEKKITVAHTENGVTDIEENTNTKIRFDGGNERQVVIIVEDAKNSLLAKNATELLLRILGACKLSFQDIAIINIANQPLSFTNIQAEFTPKTALFFGVDAAKVGLSFIIPPYKKFEHSKCKFVFAESLDDLMQTTDAARDSKVQLWQTLKEIFNV